MTQGFLTPRVYGRGYGLKSYLAKYLYFSLATLQQQLQQQQKCTIVSKTLMSPKLGLHKLKFDHKTECLAL